ncbi:uncharacterized protein LACBIDRAFT_322549 [Laccaria bicolor S238N-H82]|uniref:Predicted protein n=1 Tax=Laccaria bicolor (strain S238N-H82 / ATCC MYA-4686) TaxID=486041 RepID=B0CWP7_LACBS|nr:uncharacterized protein LACBIDRAFT_322549 [Laccaria bicolor S238N-H82]EDR13103.1 predicted protein [Laccaria bicolor S238N-H82]|eukprot:XP_001875601.1 predicted protein [Laccaria bicolor S238N-H82]
MTPTHDRRTTTVTNGQHNPQPSLTTHNQPGMPQHHKNNTATPRHQLWQENECLQHRRDNEDSDNVVCQPRCHVARSDMATKRRMTTNSLFVVRTDTTQQRCNANTGQRRLNNNTELPCDYDTGHGCATSSQMATMHAVITVHSRQTTNHSAQHDENAMTMDDAKTMMTDNNINDA